MQTYVAQKGHRQLPPAQERVVKTEERGALPSAGIAQMGEVLNQSARVQSVVQTSQMLHASPRMAAQRALQRALNSDFGQEAIQREAMADEEEVAQANFEPTQRQPALEEDEMLQRKFEPAPDSEYAQPSQPNRTGLPDNLRAGVEALSGFSLSDVRVYYNSPQPAQLSALAYAQATDIHVGTGQEQHLPHEAWHVVQQKQGRVKPTLQMKGVAINDDVGLEHEADAMGARATISGMQWPERSLFPLARSSLVGFTAAQRMDSGDSDEIFRQHERKEREWKGEEQEEQEEQETKVLEIDEQDIEWGDVTVQGAHDQDIARQLVNREIVARAPTWSTGVQRFQFVVNDDPYVRFTTRLNYNEFELPLVRIVFSRAEYVLITWQHHIDVPADYVAIERLMAEWVIDNQLATGRHTFAFYDRNNLRVESDLYYEASRMAANVITYDVEEPEEAGSPG